MTRQLTDKQLIHRQYLQSPIWKNKRVEALNYYGPICSRCKEYGTDVHHKTYERVGGLELITDLEILCRGCHEAHHRAERAARQVKPAKIKSINRRAIFQYLTFMQRRKLINEYQFSGLAELATKINYSGTDAFVLMVASMLGFTDFHGGPTGRPDRSKTNCWRSREPKSKPQTEHYISFAEFKQLPNPLRDSGTACSTAPHCQ